MADTSNEPKAHTASVQDLMAHFGVSQNTVYNWLASDNPPPHRRPGGEYRFNLADVDLWAKKQPAEEEVA